MAFVYISFLHVKFVHATCGKDTKVDENVVMRTKICRRIIREIEMKSFLDLVTRTATRRKDMLFDSF